MRGTAVRQALVTCLLLSVDVSTGFAPRAYPTLTSSACTSASFRSRSRIGPGPGPLSEPGTESWLFQSTLEKSSVAVGSSVEVQNVNTSRLQRLKDRMWARETLEDLTAAEFACSLDANVNGEVKERKRAVDFEALLNKLDRRLLEICVQKKKETKDKDGDSDDEDAEGMQCLLPEELIKEIDTSEDSRYSLVPDKGMGSVVYSTEQREALLNRIVATRTKLAQAAGIAKLVSNIKPDSSNDLEEIRRDLKRDVIRGETIVDANTAEETIEKKGKTVIQKSDPIMYVRDDGSIDWDGALQNREALSKFGTAVWARINGQNPEMVDDEVVDQIEQGKPSNDHGKVTAKVIETEELKLMKEKLDQFKAMYREMEENHTALLNSGKFFLLIFFLHHIANISYYYL